MRSLKKTGYLAFIVVTSLLLFVVILGFRQYQLSGRYNSIITQSEEMIFQFSTIREQITRSLIEKDWQNISNAADQLKNLNSSVARLQENSLIPSEYRLDMARQLDISSLAIGAKEILSADDRLAQSLILQDKMRSLAAYLLQFDRIIVSHMRARLVQFQTVMIGALGAIICLISLSLVILYKKAIIPLLHLTEQATGPEVPSNGLQYEDNIAAEVSQFVDAINSLLVRDSEESDATLDSGKLREELAPLINESNNLSNGIINYAQLLKDTYREAELGTEEEKIVQNIIDAAERIAQLNKEI
ncbi:MAG: hypothetical protein ABFR63_00140 [Thermodesulfobacteriota bacterium]